MTSRSTKTLSHCEVTWSLSDKDELLNCLAEETSDAIRSVLKEVESGRLPVATTTCVFDTENCVRPPRHMRSFYLRVPYGVIAIKGSEVHCDDLVETLQCYQTAYPDGTTLNQIENFVLKEQKLPFALTAAEARDESTNALSLVRDYAEIFDCIPLLPLPLAVVQSERGVSEDYISIVCDLVGSRAAKAALRLHEEGPLVQYVYFFPSSPLRAAHARYGAPHIDLGLRRQTLMNQELSSVDPRSCLSNLVGLVAKSLLLGWCPVDVKQFDCGQSVSAQNVSIAGGILDCDSFVKMNELSEREMISNVLGLVATLVTTAKTILIAPRESVRLEFSDPSLTSIAVTQHIVASLNEHINLHAGSIPKQQKDIVSKAIKILEGSADVSVLDALLSTLYEKMPNGNLVGHASVGDQRGW